MTNHQVRSRLVTLRLTEKEYECIQSACSLELCSISAIARKLLLEWARTVSARPGVNQELAKIGDRLADLCKLLDGKS